MPCNKKSKSPAKRRKDATTVDCMDFTALVAAIRQAHEHCATQAKRAVNVSLTMRNWVIGWYLREYEQNGADRATYGDALLEKVAERLIGAGYKELTARYLRLCRQFAAVYPEIWESLTAKFGPTALPSSIRRSLTAKSPTSGQAAIRGTPSPELRAPTEELLNALSFTHFTELVAIDDPLKRAFYETECIRGSWSVRQLKRPIATLYFERSGLSKDKEKLAAMVEVGAETAERKLAIHDPYVFELLGLKAKTETNETSRSSSDHSVAAQRCGTETGADTCRRTTESLSRSRRRARPIGTSWAGRRRKRTNESAC